MFKNSLNLSWKFFEILQIFFKKAKEIWMFYLINIFFSLFELELMFLVVFEFPP